MMRRAERGMTSLVGMMLLGVMLLAACGLLTLERQAAQEGRGYEAEVRLRFRKAGHVEKAVFAEEPDPRGCAWVGLVKAADEGIALQAAVGRGDAVEGGEEFGGVGLAPGAEVAVAGLEGHEEGFGLAPEHFWHGQGAVLAEVVEHVALNI